MTVLELYKKGFYAAVEELMETHDNVTTYETLKEFIKTKIDDDNFLIAIHLLETLNTGYAADYYEYDYNMGTFEFPRPLRDISDLEDLCEGSVYTVMAHINSLGGEMDEVTVLEERQKGAQKYYVVKYNNIFCTAIFNGFNCTYYADDLYGRIEK